jgi:hypothetical protein
MFRDLRPHGMTGLSQTWPGIKYLPWLSCLLLIAPAAFAQGLPQVDPAGVVNSASFATPISPGSLVSIFGLNLARRHNDDGTGHTAADRTWGNISDIQRHQGLDSLCVAKPNQRRCASIFADRP